MDRSCAHAELCWWQEQRAAYAEEGGMPRRDLSKRTGRVLSTFRAELRYASRVNDPSRGLRCRVVDRVFGFKIH